MSALAGNIHAETKVTPTSTLDETGGNIVVLLETASYAQGDPYNRLCPIDGTGRSLTGCGPTAFAILCQYYKWPEHGTGSVTHMGETLDLSTHYYDYNNMLNSYSGAFTDVQATAVATLMRDLGYATKVTYGLSGTGFSETIREFKNNFNFTNSIYNPTGAGMNAMYRSDAGDESFMQMIKDNLDQGYPVLFSAISYNPRDNKENGRHIFILDGYTDNDYFHFNFGWGGNGNGWYTLDYMRVDETSDYSTEQRIYPYVIPNKAKYSINVSASPEGAGSVSASPSEQFEGSNVTLTATANSDYSFKNWTRGGEIVSYEKSFTTKATTDEASNTYVANFVSVGTSNVSISVNYNSSYGTVTYNGSAVQGTGITAKENQEVTLVATPIEGYIFSGWKVEEGTSSRDVFTNELTFLAKNGIKITAEFTLAVVDYVVSHGTGENTNANGARSSTWTYKTSSTNPVPLQLKTTSGGSEVYGLSNSYERYYAYAYDSEETGHATVTYTLSVPEGYVITGYNMTYWVSSSHKGQVTVSNESSTNTPSNTTDQYLTASGLNTQSTSFTLTASQAGQQYITIESFTVTIKKDVGSEPVTPPAVTKYNVTVTAGAGGTASASASEVEEGKTVTLTAVPDTGYEFDHWSVGTSKVSEENPYTATITANTEFTATFKEVPGGGDVELDYCTPAGNYKGTRGSRGISQLTISDDNGNSLTVSGGGVSTNFSLYTDQTTQEFVTSPGATITVGSDGEGSWMHQYFYVDFGRDGVFNVNEANCRNANVDGDLVSHTGYTGVNGSDPAVASNGATISDNENTNPDYPYQSSFNQTLPTFTIPADLAPGKYHVRHKVDWNCVDPCGRLASNGYSNNYMDDNGGGVIDFILVIPEPEYVINYTYNSARGEVVVADGYAEGAGTISPYLTSVLESGSVIKKDVCVVLVPKQYNGEINNIESFTINGADAKDALTEAVYPSYANVESGKVSDAQCWYVVIPKSQVESQGVDQNINVVFEDNVQGIGNLGFDPANGPVEYYNLQGVRVEVGNLVPGFYIVRQGESVVKILIK